MMDAIHVHTHHVVCMCTTYIVLVRFNLEHPSILCKVFVSHSQSLVDCRITLDDHFMNCGCQHLCNELKLIKAQFPVICTCDCKQADLWPGGAVDDFPPDW